ncbi:MAG TPA: hypothetical protein DCY48_01695 [Candidatus Magasanikbacteria bacterium]|nr:MAG: hypothetical protein A3I74_00605 [Candidatus Magasanikbacteria bacterium RIFCSPLOWO2_02_FULL_47_16]OGH80049.1 MAG: hypothetical protein A3C10_02620 [Candidatus Magasanikbacteria bacterium RIFCSPHIGHO2_02_FULL_48_18]OGH82664.1 MAG: hypothetical protein A3G08_03115 [Candidatus Magasanikbacteria bacterium RIFCSPLOWO2_12_FULL_47_9b]HAZ28470.1 hypothetical protein [Candidatus Magasanikbacteria bacterium]
MTQKNIETALSDLPDAPGIYLFYSRKKELIYVGKATSLRNRVRSYFAGARTPRPIEHMIHEVGCIDWRQTDSVLEAIILEANAIKKYQPKYNVDGKDDKSWNYIVMTKEEFPQVIPIRAHELKSMYEITNRTKLRKKQFAFMFGPYPGLNTKATMTLLRRLFFFSTCQKQQKSQLSKKKPCFYYQIGECLGVCTGKISSKEYTEKVIQPLRTFLRGGKKRLIKTLGTHMREASKNHDFEEAARLHDQIASLQRIQDIALLNASFVHDPLTHGTAAEYGRIEGYDISNFGSAGKVGSMVVFINGMPDKKEYRHFTIRTVKGQSDVDCLAEVIERRLKHVLTSCQTSESMASKVNCQKSTVKSQEWPLPNVFLVDGGKPQVNCVKKIFAEKQIDIPVVGIAKGPDRKKNEFVLGEKNSAFVRWVYRNKKVLIHVRDEAHRFAIAHQKIRRGRSFLLS